MLCLVRYLENMKTRYFLRLKLSNSSYHYYIKVTKSGQIIKYIGDNTEWESSLTLKELTQNPDVFKEVSEEEMALLLSL